MTTVLQVVQRVQVLMRAETGINYVYNYPPESMNEKAPIGVVYAGTAEHDMSTITPMGRITANDTVVIEVLWPRMVGSDTVIAACYPYLDSVPVNVLTDPTLRDLIFAIKSFKRLFPYLRETRLADQTRVESYLGVRWDMGYRLDTTASYAA